MQLNYLLIIFSVLLILVGISLLLKPEIFFNFVDKYLQSLQGQIVIAVLSLALGVLLFSSADGSRFPNLFMGIGLFSIIGAVIIAVFPPADFKSLISWELKFLAPFGWILGLCYALIGGLLIYAVLPENPDFTGDLAENSMPYDETEALAARYGGEVRYIDSNGIRLRIVVAGEGPLVILIHGWPESWYSWRHQLQPLAAAGYRVVAPDMRGYGGSTLPTAIEAYDTVQLTADVAGIVAALGESTAVVVGHDWGAPIAWRSALLYPDVFRAVVGMSVVYTGRSSNRPLRKLRQDPEEDFFYTAYFQEPGVAEAEFDADPRALISRLYTSRSPGTPTAAPEVTDPRASAGGWIKRLGEPIRLPDWLSEVDLDYYVSEFERAGFRGGINYYRNSVRNWELTPQLAGARILQPALFLAGDLDIVNRGATQEQLASSMQPHFQDLRDVILLPGIGHRVQQQSPEATNRVLINFLDSLE